MNKKEKKPLNLKGGPGFEPRRALGSSLALAAGLAVGIALWREYTRRRLAAITPGARPFPPSLARRDQLSIDADSISASGRREGDDGYYFA